MKLATEIVASSPSEIEYFPELKMEITKEGVEIYAKAPLFSEWIQRSQVSQRDAGGATLPTWTRAGVGKFYYPSEAWAYSRANMFAQANMFGLFCEERANMLWLFHVGLAEGCTTTLKGPVSANNFEDYFESCCRNIQDLYVKELRRVVIAAHFKEVLP